MCVHTHECVYVGLPWRLTSYCALLELVELALDEAQDQTGLAHGRLPQKHQLELADLVAGVGPVGACRSSPVGHDLCQSPHSVSLTHTHAALSRCCRLLGPNTHTQTNKQANG